MSVEWIDHLAITVSDMDATLDFYKAGSGRHDPLRRGISQGRDPGCDPAGGCFASLRPPRLIAGIAPCHDAPAWKRGYLLSMVRRALNALRRGCRNKDVRDRRGAGTAACRQRRNGSFRLFP